MSVDKAELIQFFDNFKKDMRSEMKSVVEEIIQREINKLNVSLVLEEHEKNLKNLKQENVELKAHLNRQQRVMESFRRRNNLVLFGLDEVTGENNELLELLKRISWIYSIMC